MLFRSRNIFFLILFYLTEQTSPLRKAGKHRFPKDIFKHTELRRLMVPDDNPLVPLSNSVSSAFGKSPVDILFRYNYGSSVFVFFVRLIYGGTTPDCNRIFLSATFKNISIFLSGVKLIFTFISPCISGEMKKIFFSVVQEAVLT